MRKLESLEVGSRNAACDELSRIEVGKKDDAKRIQQKNKSITQCSGPAARLRSFAGGKQHFNSEGI
jgi:hypothetical protein